MLPAMLGAKAENPMKDAAFTICDHLTEAQAILHDHLECGRLTPLEALQRVNKILSEPRLLLAMQGVGYFENCLCEDTENAKKARRRHEADGGRRMISG